MSNLIMIFTSVFQKIMYLVILSSKDQKLPLAFSNLKTIFKYLVNKATIQSSLMGYYKYLLIVPDLSLLITSS